MVHDEKWNGVAISATMVLASLKRSPAENHDDRLACSNCNHECPAWCLNLRRQELNSRWIENFRSA
jgi:hypothetical protein